MTADGTKVWGECHCRAVRYIVARAPEEVKDCNCSACRKRGLLWAYYSPGEVNVEGETASYMWGDRTMELHFCPVCACVTHWTPVDKSYDRMGVNARLLAPEILAAARIRRFDGADTWTFLDE